MISGLGAMKSPVAFDLDSRLFHDFDPGIERWAALKTSARWEKKVASQLADISIPVFLPTMRQRTQYATKTNESHIPLFSCYLFVSSEHFLGNPRVSPFTRGKIATVLTPPNPEALRRELLDLRGLLCSHQLVQEKVYGKVGDLVKIVRGPMSGTEGTILRLKPNQKKLVLEIGFLNRRLEIEIGEEWVAKII